MRGSLLAALLLTGCWSLEGQYDPGRCDPRCGAGLRCDEGSCVPRSDLDASTDSALRDGGPPADSGPINPWTLIKKGTFMMGSPAGEFCNPAYPSKVDETRHQVTLTRDFELMTTEVTQDHFVKVMGYNNSYFSLFGGVQVDCPTCPVEYVNWHEAAAFCNALSSAKGLAPCYSCSGEGVMVSCQTRPAYAGGGFYGCPGYRLPTEAEWERACRAGTTTALYSGDTITKCKEKDPAADKIGWNNFNSGGRPHGVGTKPANPWGLHDMAGNVSEWCQDSFVKDLGAAAVTDPLNAAKSLTRVRRGNNWGGNPTYARAGARLFGEPLRRLSWNGLRCARTVAP